jgi:hypothetical protein
MYIMTILLSERQLTRIFDLDEEDREMIGHGAEHSVYTTKFSENYLIKLGLKNGGLVMKTGSYDTIIPYAKQFEKNSDIFPFVIKYGRLNNKSKKYRGDTYMVIEKLDAQKFKSMLITIYDVIRKIASVDKEYSRFAINFKSYTFSDGKFHDEDRTIIAAIAKRYCGPQYFDFYNNLIELVDKLYTMSEYKKIDMSPTAGYLDLHLGNFGISKRGEIKCLDY